MPRIKDPSIVGVPQIPLNASQRCTVTHLLAVPGLAEDGNYDIVIINFHELVEINLNFSLFYELSFQR